MTWVGAIHDDGSVTAFLLYNKGVVAGTRPRIPVGAAARMTCSSWARVIRGPSWRAGNGRRYPTALWSQDAGEGRGLAHRGHALGLFHHDLQQVL